MTSIAKFTKNLRHAASLLNPQENFQLISDIETICQQLVDSSFRIAVVAPFNFGKSTLLNALLGQDLMPTKCVRTTGSPIKIKYGKNLKIRLTFKSGEVIKSSFVEILQEYVVLDRQGNIRKDIVSVEVCYPHPLLKKGVEFLDLPGINDTQEQNQLVCDELLQVDLVILILHAQQLFTLTEQDIINQWLVNRGIKNVVFVINWMNKLKNRQNCRVVYHEAKVITDDFKLDFQSELLYKIKNLYRVDALPALKAKKNHSIFKIVNSGLANFEAALYTIYSRQKSEVFHTRFPRAKIIKQQLQQQLQNQAQLITKEIKILEEENSSSSLKLQQLEQSLKEEFNSRVAALRHWLTLPNLKTTYHFEAALALQESKFHIWKQNFFKPDLLIYKQALETLTENIGSELQKNLSKKLDITFPRSPQVDLADTKAKSLGEKFINIFRKKSQKKPKSIEYDRDLWQVYEKAVDNYFAQFSKEALKKLVEYEAEIQPFIICPKPKKSPAIATKYHELELINDSLNKLEQSRLFESEDNKYRALNQMFFVRFAIFIKYLILTLFWNMFGKI